MALRTKMASLSDPSSRPSLYLYLGLRLLQFGSMTMTMSYFCALVGWHNLHYCSKVFGYDECRPDQRDHAKVPMLYIIFITTFCVMFPAGVRLSSQHVSTFFDSTTARDDSTGPSDSDSNSTIQDLTDTASTFSQLSREILRSATKSALVFDSAVFVVLSLCLKEYWSSIIRPNHMYPGRSPIPLCWLFSHNNTNYNYWKNLTVPQQHCAENLISFYGTVGILSFTLLLMAVNVVYLRHDSLKKESLTYNVPVEAPEKCLLVDVAA